MKRIQFRECVALSRTIKKLSARIANEEEWRRKKEKKSQPRQSFKNILFRF